MPLYFATLQSLCMMMKKKRVKGGGQITTTVFLSPSALAQHISNQGWAYVKCPQQPCAVFLDEKKSPDILAQLQAQKHPQFIA